MHYFRIATRVEIDQNLFQLKTGLFQNKAVIEPLPFETPSAG